MSKQKLTAEHLADNPRLLNSISTNLKKRKFKLSNQGDGVQIRIFGREKQLYHSNFAYFLILGGGKYINVIIPNTSFYELKSIVKAAQKLSQERPSKQDLAAIFS